jgi:hypothetical protein
MEAEGPRRRRRGSGTRSAAERAIASLGEAAELLPHRREDEVAVVAAGGEWRRWRGGGGGVCEGFGFGWGGEAKDRGGRREKEKGVWGRDSEAQSTGIEECGSRRVRAVDV